jgi:hypothetical protein
MSAPIKQDAAFRVTENGQSTLHYLGAKIRRPYSPPRHGDVSTWESPDESTRRTVTIASVAQDLVGTLRYDGQPYQLNEMLKAGIRGATLEYFPSLSNPSEVYPCDLVGHGAVGTDPDLWWDNRYSVADVHLRRRDGGHWLGVLVGSLFYWKAGNQLPGMAFTRAGTALARGSDGIYASVAANILRTDWAFIDGVLRPTTLLEAPRANVLLDSAEIDATGSANWAGTWTQAVATSVFEGETAQRYTNDGVTSSNPVSQNTPTVVGTLTTSSVIVENVDAVTTEFGLRDETVGGFVVRAQYTWSTNAIAISASAEGTSVGVRAIVLAEGGPNGGKIVRLEAFAVASNPGNAGRLYIYPTGVGINSLSAILHHAQYESGRVATSPIVTTTVALARPDEKMTAAPGFMMEDIRAAGGATFYQEWIERGTAWAAGSSTRYWQVGNDRRLLIFSSSSGNGTIDGSFFATGIGSATSGPSTVVPIGSPAAARLLVYRDPADSLWKVQLGVSVDGAAEVLGAVSTFGATLPDFDVDLMTFAASHDANVEAPVGLQAIKGVPGVRSLAEMSAA